MADWRISGIVRPDSTPVLMASSGVAWVRASQDSDAGNWPPKMTDRVSGSPRAVPRVLGGNHWVMTWGKLISITT